MPSQSGDAQEPDVSLGTEPTDAEIEAWAARERERREAWLHGPTQAQKLDWAERERARRMGERSLAAFRLPAPSPDAVRLAQHYMRDMQLATEGAFSLLLNVSVRDVFDQLIRAGREWEDEYTSRPVRRRRVALDSAAADVDAGAGRPTRKPAESPGESSQPS
jgi:hypothetical protein